MKKHHTIFLRFSLALLCILGMMTLLTGCRCRILSVRTSYFTEESLASYYVGTPDPNLLKPLIGQRLIFSWNLPKTAAFTKTYLDVRIHFKNHTEEKLRVIVNHKNGYYVYHISDEKYLETGGMISYKAEMRNACGLLEAWHHPLWKEFILFPDKNTGK